MHQDQYCIVYLGGFIRPILAQTSPSATDWSPTSQQLPKSGSHTWTNANIQTKLLDGFSIKYQHALDEVLIKSSNSIFQQLLLDDTLYTIQFISSKPEHLALI